MSIVPPIRRFALALGVIGCAFFALAFLVSVVNPGLVEQGARSLIRFEVERKVHEKIEALDNHFLAGKAAVLAKNYAGELALTKRLVAQQLPARLADVIAEMQDLNCECRRKIETSIHSGFDWRIANIAALQERLTALIRSKYMETANQVIREFRIFTGTNALVFAFLLIAVWVKRRAGVHLLPAAFVLLATAAVTAFVYLFNQDWLHTLLFNDFVGFAYVGYLAGAFALLCDIIFNQARITAEAMNIVLSAVGSALQVVPC
jgi:hypothetical protein